MTTRVASIVSLFFLSTSAWALNTRSAVSLNGLDTNSCAPAAPCRSFGAAIAQTMADGEVIALDSAGYGPFTVSNAIAVVAAPGAHAAITATTGSAITILATGTDKVLLRNLVLIGNGTGDVGIDEIVAQEVRVFNCLVRGFTTAGIRDRAVSGNVVLDHSTILDTAPGDGTNPGYGFAIIAGGGTRNGTIIDCLFSGNDIGIHADRTTYVAVIDTTINRSTIGAEANNTGNLFITHVVLKNCTVTANGTGVFSNGPNGSITAVWLSHTVIAHNPVAANQGGSGQLYSFGDNRFVHNFNDGAVLTPAPSL